MRRKPTHTHTARRNMLKNAIANLDVVHLANNSRNVYCTRLKVRRKTIQNAGKYNARKFTDRSRIGITLYVLSL